MPSVSETRWGPVSDVTGRGRLTLSTCPGRTGHLRAHPELERLGLRRFEVEGQSGVGEERGGEFGRYRMRLSRFFTIAARSRRSPRPRPTNSAGPWAPNAPARKWPNSMTASTPAPPPTASPASWPSGSSTRSRRSPVMGFRDSLEFNESESRAIPPVGRGPWLGGRGFHRGRAEPAVGLECCFREIGERAGRRGPLQFKKGIRPAYVLWALGRAVASTRCEHMTEDDDHDLWGLLAVVVPVAVAVGDLAQGRRAWASIERLGSNTRSGPRLTDRTPDGGVLEIVVDP
jgi:hypothetical protein